MRNMRVLVLKTYMGAYAFLMNVCIIVYCIKRKLNHFLPSKI